MRNKEGIVISCPYDVAAEVGSTRFEVQEKQELLTQFEIKNDSDRVILFKKCELLKDIKVYRLFDAKNVSSGTLVVSIAPGKPLRLSYIHAFVG